MTQDNEARAIAELAERCEKATGPDRNLDNSIRLATNSGCAFGEDPAYTSSLDAAMTLVPEGLHWRAGINLQGACTAIAGDAVSLAATPALALCAAALRARSVLMEKSDAR